MQEDSAQMSESTTVLPASLPEEEVMLQRSSGKKIRIILIGFLIIFSVLGVSTVLLLQHKKPMSLQNESVQNHPSTENINPLVVPDITVSITPIPIYPNVTFTTPKPIGNGKIYYSTLMAIPGTIGKATLDIPVIRSFDLATAKIQTIYPGDKELNSPESLWEGGLLSPDGKQLAIQNNEALIIRDVKSNVSTTVLTDIKSADPHQYKGDKIYYPYAWSPDGKYLLITIGQRSSSAGYLAFLDMKTKEVHMINDTQGKPVDDGCKFYAWSPDSTKVLFYNGKGGSCPTGGLSIVNTANYVSTSLNGFIPQGEGQKKSFPGVEIAFWSPDGTHIYFLREVANFDTLYPKTVFSVIDTNGQGLKDLPMLQDSGKISLGIFWAGNNHFVYSSGGSIWLYNTTTGQDLQVIKAGDDIAIRGVSPNKRYAIFQTGVHVTYGANGTRLKSVTDPLTKNIEIKLSAINLDTKEITDIEGGTRAYKYEGFSEK